MLGLIFWIVAGIGIVSISWGPIYYYWWINKNESCSGKQTEVNKP